MFVKEVDEESERERESAERRGLPRLTVNGSNGIFFLLAQLFRISLQLLDDDTQSSIRCWRRTRKKQRARIAIRQAEEAHAPTRRNLARLLFFNAPRAKKKT